MKVKVIKPFRDKYTGERYKANHVFEDMTKERFEEILAVGELVEEIKEEEVKSKKKTTKKASKKSC